MDFFALAEELQLKGLDADKEVAADEPIKKDFKTENLHGKKIKMSKSKLTNNERVFLQNYEESKKSYYKLVSTDVEKLLVNMEIWKKLSFR